MQTMAEQFSNTSYTLPYKFNGKELDKETGLYYYGARYYDPRTGVWLGTDPLANEYPSISPFAFVANNCINAIDPDGCKIIFVNGYYNTGSLSGLAGSVGGQGYWGTDLISGAQTFFGDKKNRLCRWKRSLEFNRFRKV